MAEKANVFTSDHEAFLEALADLGHFQLLVGWQLELAQGSVTKSVKTLEEMGHTGYGAGNCMTITNLFHEGEWAHHEPYGARVSEGKRLPPMAKELEGRFNSFLLVWVFEALERHVQGLYGKLLYQLRDEVPVTEKQDFHRRFPKMAKRERTPQYFAAYAAFCWKRDDGKVIAALERHLAWQRVRRPAYLGMPWRDYIAAVAFCRHRIVHNDGRVSEGSRRELSADQWGFVRECLQDSPYSRHKHLLPPRRRIDDLFEAVASYAWALYVLMSARCNMANESRFFRPMGDGGRAGEPK